MISIALIEMIDYVKSPLARCRLHHGTDDNQYSAIRNDRSRSWTTLYLNWLVVVYTTETMMISIALFEMIDHFL